MPQSDKPTDRPGKGSADSSRCTPSDRELVRLIQGHFQASREVRRGICLLNAGRYDEADKAFARAASFGGASKSLPSYLAACMIGKGSPRAAADQFEKAVQADARQTTARIRHAFACWQAGNREEAIESLREGVRANPESAELHFQLGTLLAAMAEYDEAELRFTQALSIDRDHTEALVSLAMCCGLRNATAEAIRHLQRAQAHKPYDARIGLLLAQAAKAVHQRGQAVRVRADMPPEMPTADQRGIEELSKIIEADPDFVDAFLSIPIRDIVERVFAMLLRTLEVALERQPEHAELHYHCGRVLDRLGRRDDAISQNERAVEIAPKFIQALIELGKLYHQTDRCADATGRLEQAVEAGADYADVHFLLGNLYREQGQVNRARSAYRRALTINHRYEAAQKALEALPA